LEQPWSGVKEGNKRSEGDKKIFETPPGQAEGQRGGGFQRGTKMRKKGSSIRISKIPDGGDGKGIGKPGLLAVVQSC